MIYSMVQSLAKVLAGKGIGTIPGIRFLYDSLVRTLWSGEKVIDVEGSKMYVDLDEEDPVIQKTLQAYITTEHWDEVTTEIFKQSINKGDTVLDLGANVGYYSLLASRLTGKTGKVFAFEPEPRNYRILQRNIELNNYTNIYAFQKAVSDENTSLTLHISEKDSGAHTIRPTQVEREFENEVNVEVVRLDDFLIEKAGSVDVVKMDIEGSEPKALAGMKKYIHESKKIKIFMEFYPDILEDAGFSPKEFAQSLFDEYGFSVTLIDDYWKSKEIKPVYSAEDIIDSMKAQKIINLLLEKKEK